MRLSRFPMFATLSGPLITDGAESSIIAAWHPAPSAIVGESKPESPSSPALGPGRSLAHGGIERARRHCGMGRCAIGWFESCSWAHELGAREPLRQLALVRKTSRTGVDELPGRSNHRRGKGGRARDSSGEIYVMNGNPGGTAWLAGLVHIHSATPTAIDSSPAVAYLDGPDKPPSIIVGAGSLCGD